MQTTMTKAEAFNVLEALSLSEREAIDLLILSSRLTDAQAGMAELRKEFIAKLPVATEEQLDAVIALVRNEEAVPEGLRVNVDFRLTEVQGAKVKEARDERASYCEANADALLKPILTDVTQKLRSFKVRQTAKRVVTTARWEKTVGTTEESRALVARLARATSVIADEEAKAKAAAAAVEQELAK